MSWAVRVVRNRYVDSVRLMQVAQTCAPRTACGRARSSMGTPANLEAARAVRRATPARPTS